MKKIIVLFATVLAMNTSNVFAANDETVITITTTNTTQSESNFYTCQFSLNHYRGTIHNGYTNPIKVKLNCPQEKDVSATVFVYIDGNRVASEIFTVEAGKTESSATNKTISVSDKYHGKDYVLDLK